jgi:hypothetical protein
MNRRPYQVATAAFFPPPPSGRELAGGDTQIREAGARAAVGKHGVGGPRERPAAHRAHRRVEGEQGGRSSAVGAGRPPDRSALSAHKGAERKHGGDQTKNR